MADGKVKVTKEEGASLGCKVGRLALFLAGRSCCLPSPYVCLPSVAVFLSMCLLNVDVGTYMCSRIRQLHGASGALGLHGPCT